MLKTGSGYSKHRSTYDVYCGVYICTKISVLKAEIAVKILLIFVGNRLIINYHIFYFVNLSQGGNK